ncbi:MAG TPA: co-chaperone DjlA, partial [Pinirhizobacter sp.]|nr:co-chaperone DjlA [Pinirhizobacter sp.]
MNFTGTLIGALIGFFLLHGPIGAVIGGMLGFMFDAGRNRREATPAAGGFIGPLYAILGAVAKADGRVSPQEIAVAERLMGRMNLNPEQR